ncbi:hypothetical protein BIV57_16250 [Mangrovactinospora gilvigrisea]|uniref:Clp R domain-containing protein n=1 Tax=Mangrovactinospora gilvigrisea TaxID=1428644 RepID=A0A1J7BCL5_9ACTN|nr:Clp protease N-terminal domain-containing protein [Mangrovactinospora gilvigrisea]OIV36419.1 hypothetical protein BIV57_16250 [Mangrovactinospora gilvigrisea]
MTEKQEHSESPELPVRLDDLIGHVRAVHPDGDALIHLEDAVQLAASLGELSDHLVGHFVDQARRGGASWTEIGSHMGVTKQAAQKRFVEKATAGLTENGVTMERFTARARVVVEKAAEAARATGFPAVRSEHILLGLLEEPQGLAAVAIQGAGADLEDLRAAARAALEEADHDDLAAGAFPRVLTLTLRQALMLGHNYIGTEHILLALFDDPGNPVTALLTTQGAAPETVRAGIAELLRGYTKK